MDTFNRKHELTPLFDSHFKDAEKYNKLVAVVAPVDSSPEVKLERETTGPSPIHSNLAMHASILSPESSVSHTFDRPKGYLHLIMRQTGYRGPKTKLDGKGPRLSVKLGDAEAVTLEEGDGVYLDQVEGRKVDIQSVGDGDAEFVLFDLANEA